MSSSLSGPLHVSTDENSPKVDSGQASDDNAQGPRRREMGLFSFAKFWHTPEVISASMAPVPFQTLLENNDAGRIENPLARLDEDDLIADIQDFHADPLNNLGDVVDVEVLIRGGLLAKDEEVAIAEKHINEREKAALEKEKYTTIWRESKELRVNLLTCCVASVLQGWAQGAIVGANQGWADEFGLITGFDGPNNVQGQLSDIWRFSATNAIVYFAASSVGR
ncbi:MAG: hypothetical protein Q9195_009348 [Heterodermia aff. obscurata]